MAEFESCDKCKYNEKSETEYPCNQCVHNATDKFKPMTRADKIRSMSDEELAEFLVNFKNTFGEEYEGEMSCLEYLKSETE